MRTYMNADLSECLLYRRHDNRKCVAMGLVSGVAKGLRLYGCKDEGFAKA
jgi:hypothetical protein